MILMTQSWIAGALFCFLAMGDLNAAETRVALTIGNSTYMHMSARSSARPGAAQVAEALEGLGFHVIRAYDVDKAGLEASARDFGNRLAGAEVGVFFYAGRGLQIAGRNYLVPVDAQPLTGQTLDAQTVPLDLVDGVLEGKAKTKIILIDADRDNPLSVGRKTGFASAPASMEAGALISFSTQPGNVAVDASDGSSPYIAALLRRIAVADKDLAAALDEVRGDVMAATNYKQVPWYHSSLQEKFYFVRPSTK
jgi:uncharacterized caspase-like protein